MKQIALSGFLAALLTTGCGGTTTGNPTVDTSATEIAESSLSGAVNSTEPNGTQAFYMRLPTQSVFARVMSGLSPVQTSFASGLCPTLRSGGAAACGASVSDTSVMNYSQCTFSGSSLTVWNGSQSVAFSPGCPSISLAGFAGTTLTRTFTAGTTEKTVLGISTTIDTANAPDSGWSATVGRGEQAVFTGAGDGSRTLTILGLHLHAVTANGTTLFDHTISSTAVTVTGAGVLRTASNGTVTVQHNLAKYIAQAQITTPLSYSVASCCHPGSGVITSTLTGSVTGTETLTFTGASTGTCGTATLQSSGSSSSSSVVLSHCF